MIEDYSRQTGRKFTFTVGPTGMLRDTIMSGKPADLVITSAPLMAELERTGKIAPDSRADIGRVGLGVIIRDAAAIPLSGTDPVNARAFVAALTGPAMRDRWIKAGWQPAR